MLNVITGELTRFAEQLMLCWCQRSAPNVDQAIWELISKLLYVFSEKIWVWALSFDYFYSYFFYFNILLRIKFLFFINFFALKSLVCPLVFNLLFFLFNQIFSPYYPHLSHLYIQGIMLPSSPT